MRLALVCFYCLCVFVYVLYFIATMSFAGYFLSVIFCLLSMLISDSRFDLVWFRLSCDHGWIRSGSVNVRKQQQQPPSSGARGKSHSSGKTRSLPHSTTRATRRSAETTAASRSCHTRVRFSIKWLPGGSALTVRRRDCYQRSSAGFDRIARPRT